MENEGTPNQESLKSEWGIDIDTRINWDDAIRIIEELNTNLPEGEKPWRLPTSEELLEADRLKTKGFKEGAYWASEESVILDQGKPPVMANIVLMGIGYKRAQNIGKGMTYFVRLIRDGE